MCTSFDKKLQKKTSSLLPGLGKKVKNLKAGFLHISSVDGLSQKAANYPSLWRCAAEEVQMTLIFYVNGGAVRPGNHLVSLSQPKPGVNIVIFHTPPPPAV